MRNCDLRHAFITMNAAAVCSMNKNCRSNSAFVKDSQRHSALGSPFHHLETVFESSLGV